MMDSQIDLFKNLFKTHFDKEVDAVSNIAPSGSDRTYFRLSGGGKEAIGAFSKNVKENNTYFYFTRIFTKVGLPVPEIFQQASRNTCYLMEDLGQESLLDVLLREGKTDEILHLYEKAVEDLVQFQWEAGRQIDYTMCYGSQHFDSKAILADLNYFKTYFADVLKLSYDKAALQDELEQWAKSLEAEPIKSFMYRDFQSRNIMVKDGKLGYIDFQGGMHGLPHYDLVSLLWQAKAQLPDLWKEKLLKHYLKTLKSSREMPDLDENHFQRIYLECALVRILQTLGAYGLRGLIERKQHFLSSIYPALQQLESYLREYSSMIKYPELSSILHEIVKPKFLKMFFTPKQNEENPLKVSIYSFSYKKGLPDNDSSHGGGFVFDCRGILNPGRFEQYKQLTGRDYDVQEFLKSQTLMPTFLDNVFGVVDISINDYLTRSFDSLTISFGCTGGQHRSVYAAEQMKQHLKDSYNIEAELLHLEQDPNDLKRR